jgi:type IV secretory pathway component VirB8
MEAAAKLIAEDIKTGKYFAEARHWYNRVYLQPLSETSIVFTMMAIFVGTLLVVTYNLFSIFPIVTKVDTLAFLPSTLENYPVIKNIAKPEKTTKEVVLEYLCDRYVKAIESYNYSNLIYNYNFIFRSSSKQLFDNYYQNLAISNPNSPLVLYQDTKTVEIIIIDTNVQVSTGSAIVKFNKIVRDAQNKELSNTYLTSNLNFYIDNYDFSKSINSRLNFIVTKYNTKQTTT